VVFGGRAHHCWATDIDLFDALVEASTGRDRGLERVQVHHEQLERRHIQSLKLRHVLGFAGISEEPGVHSGMQRLDPPIQALRETGKFLDPGY
jgi:hypothetical protein